MKNDTEKQPSPTRLKSLDDLVAHREQLTGSPNPEQFLNLFEQQAPDSVQDAFTALRTDSPELRDGYAKAFEQRADRYATLYAEAQKGAADNAERKQALVRLGAGIQGAHIKSRIKGKEDPISEFIREKATIVSDEVLWTRIREMQVVASDAAQGIQKLEALLARWNTEGAAAKEKAATGSTSVSAKAQGIVADRNADIDRTVLSPEDAIAQQNASLDDEPTVLPDMKVVKGSDASNVAFGRLSMAPDKIPVLTDVVDPATLTNDAAPETPASSSKPTGDVPVLTDVVSENERAALAEAATPLPREAAILAATSEKASSPEIVPDAVPAGVDAQIPEAVVSEPAPLLNPIDAQASVIPNVGTASNSPEFVRAPEAPVAAPVVPTALENPVGAPDTIIPDLAPKARDFSDTTAMPAETPSATKPLPELSSLLATPEVAVPDQFPPIIDRPAGDSIDLKLTAKDDDIDMKNIPLGHIVPANEDLPTAGASTGVDIDLGGKFGEKTMPLGTTTSPEDGSLTPTPTQAREMRLQSEPTPERAAYEGMVKMRREMRAEYEGAEKSYQDALRAHVAEQSKSWNPLKRIPYTARKIFGYNPKLTPELQEAKNAATASAMLYTDALQSFADARLYNKLASAQKIGGVESVEGAEQIRRAEALNARYKRVFAQKVLMERVRSHHDIVMNAPSVLNRPEVQKALELFRKTKWARAGTVVGIAALGAATGGIGAALMAGGLAGTRIAAGMSFGMLASQETKRLYDKYIGNPDTAALTQRNAEQMLYAQKNLSSTDYEDLVQEMEKNLEGITKTQKQGNVAAGLAGFAAGGLISAGMTDENRMFLQTKIGSAVDGIGDAARGVADTFSRDSMQALQNTLTPSPLAMHGAGVTDASAAAAEPSLGIGVPPEQAVATTPTVRLAMPDTPPQVSGTEEYLDNNGIVSPMAPPVIESVSPELGIGSPMGASTEAETRAPEAPAAPQVPDNVVYTRSELPVQTEGDGYLVTDPNSTGEARPGRVPFVPETVVPPTPVVEAVDRGEAVDQFRAYPGNPHGKILTVETPMIPGYQSSPGLISALPDSRLTQDLPYPQNIPEEVAKEAFSKQWIPGTESTPGHMGTLEEAKALGMFENSPATPEAAPSAGVEDVVESAQTYPVAPQPSIESMQSAPVAPEVDEVLADPRGAQIIQNNETFDVSKKNWLGFTTTETMTTGGAVYEQIKDMTLGELQRVYLDPQYRATVFPNGVASESLDRWRIFIEQSNTPEHPSSINLTLREFMNNVLKSTPKL